MNSNPILSGGTAAAYTIPTDAPEGDGTFLWNSTTLIVVELTCGNTSGLGYTYSHSVTAPLARDLIDNAVKGADPFQTNSATTGARASRPQRSPLSTLPFGI